MPTKIVECVPNFSEGRDAAKIKAITDAVEAVPGIRLLHVDPGPDANRTVVTFVGSPGAVAEAAFQAIAKAAQLIDMRHQHGGHPRLGATDVCPFVPIEGVTLDDCAEIARTVGRRVGDELGISVYFYEAAAANPKRRNLADIRRGEYEGLAEKLRDDFWRPDCGPAVFNARSGATVIGAREFLIAYNINLNTRDKSAAADIAAKLRESGCGGRPGEFKFCKAIGWHVAEFGRAQISMNLTNYRVTPPHLVLERARQLAAERGLAVTGSELVGMIPFAALLEAGKFYLAQQGRSADIPVADILETAVAAMGLRDVRPFDVRQKVIGLPSPEAPSLVALPVAEFIEQVSRGTPTPGGGSVAAMAGSLGAALATMVATISQNKPRDEEGRTALVEIAERAQTIKHQLLAAVDEDAMAYHEYLEALRLPHETPGDWQFRQQKTQASLKRATQISYETASACLQAMRAAHEAALAGHAASRIDAAVGCALALAGVRGALWNAQINLKSLKDTPYADELRQKCADLLEEALVFSRENENHVNGLLS